jgi:hypothetical protein
MAIYGSRHTLFRLNNWSYQISPPANRLVFFTVVADSQPSHRRTHSRGLAVFAHPLRLLRWPALSSSCADCGVRCAVTGHRPRPCPPRLLALVSPCRLRLCTRALWSLPRCHPPHPLSSPAPATGRLHTTYRHPSPILSRTARRQRVGPASPPVDHHHQ